MYLRIDDISATRAGNRSTLLVIMIIHFNNQQYYKTRY